MQYRKHPNGKSYPITPSAGSSIETFRNLLDQDKARKQIVVKNKPPMLNKVKPNTIEVSLEAKNMYLPGIKATWKLKKD